MNDHIIMIVFKDNNKKNIIKSLDDYIENLVHINSLIKNDRFNEVESQLKSTNYIKTILKKYRSLIYHYLTLNSTKI